MCSFHCGGEIKLKDYKMNVTGEVDITDRNKIKERDITFERGLRQTIAPFSDLNEKDVARIRDLFQSEEEYTLEGKVTGADIDSIFRPLEFSIPASNVPTSAKAIFDPDAEITIGMPNKDTMMGQYTVCPKEVMLRAWQDKVGKYIPFMDTKKKVLSVEVVNEYIYVKIK